MNVAKPYHTPLLDPDTLTNPFPSILTVFSGHVVSRLCIPALLCAFLPAVLISTASSHQIVFISIHGVFCDVWYPRAFSLQPPNLRVVSFRCSRAWCLNVQNPGGTAEV